MNNKITSTITLGTNYGTARISFNYDNSIIKMVTVLSESNVNLNLIKNLAILHWLIKNIEKFSEFYTINSIGELIINFDRVFSITNSDTIELRILYIILEDYNSIVTNDNEFNQLLIWSLIMNQTLDSDFTIFFIKQICEVEQDQDRYLYKKILNIETKEIMIYQYNKDQLSRIQRNINIIVKDNRNSEYRVRLQPFNDFFTVDMIYHSANNKIRALIEKRLDYTPSKMVLEEYSLTFEELYFYVQFRRQGNLEDIVGIDKGLATIFSEPIDSSYDFSSKETWLTMHLMKGYQIVGVEEYLYETDEHENLLKVLEKWYFHFELIKMMVEYYKPNNMLI